MNQKLIEKFEQELIYRVTLKAQSASSPHKVILEAFKYYDLSNLETVEWKNFKNVILIKFGLTSVTEGDLNRIYDHYCRGEEHLPYKRFVSEIFRVVVNSCLSSKVLKSIDKKPEIQKDWKISLTNQLNSMGDNSYINFLKILQRNDNDFDNFLRQEEFIRALKAFGFDFSKAELESIFSEFHRPRTGFNLHTFVEALVPNFNTEKQEIVNNAFSRINQKGYKHIMFDLLLSSFRAQNHPDFLTGVKSESEIRTQFFDSLKSFLVCYQLDHELISKQLFLRFFEFYGRNWNVNHLKAVVNNSFFVNPAVSSNYDLLENQVSPQHDVYHQKKMEQNDQERGKSVENSNKLPQIQNEKADYRKQNRGQSVVPANKQYSNIPNAFSIKKKEIDESYRPEISKNEEIITSKILNLENFPPDKSLNFDTPKPSKIDALNFSLNRTFEQKKSPQALEKTKLQQVLKDRILFLSKFSYILKIEYDLLLKSNSAGNVDYEVFCVVLDKFELLFGLKEIEKANLFMSFLNQKGEFHVQYFANNLRGQMSAMKERACIDLFKRVSGEKGEVHLDVIYQSFLPHKFNFCNYRTQTESKGMFKELLASFGKVNLQPHKKDYFVLEDFLYLMDNLAFFMPTDDQFVNTIINCFK